MFGVETGTLCGEKGSSSSVSGSPVSGSSLEVRILVDLGGAQWVSSVDSGGGRGADVGLVSELGLVLAMMQGGRGQHAVAHADRNLVHDARRVGPVLDRVARRALGRHQVGHGAGGAQRGGGRVGVEVRLAGQVRGSQVWVNIAGVRWTAVMEGVLSLRGDVRGNVGLLSPMSCVPLSHHVLLGLEEEKREVSELLLRRFERFLKEIAGVPKSINYVSWRKYSSVSNRV